MPSDDQFDEELRRLASQSTQDRASVVDVDAALEDHRHRVASPARPVRVDRRRWWAAAAAVAVIVAGVAAIAWPRDGSREDVVSSPVATGTVVSGDTGVDVTAGSVPTTQDPVASPEVADSEDGLVGIDHVVLIDGAPVGDSWVTGLARSGGELDKLWNEIGLSSPVPTVDFDTTSSTHNVSNSSIRIPDRRLMRIASVRSGSQSLFRLGKGE